jgi:class 3 adenylate cyclase
VLTCAACGTENPPEARFCDGCGSALSATCPSCGAPHRPNARFCGRCGTPLGAAPATPGPTGTAVRPAEVPVQGPTAERRICSVLFADLVGFTPLSEARDPEDVRELLSGYFGAARTVVRRYGGTVEKFIGDAVMAVWGTPVAAEGDAERAVRAALDVVDAVAALGAQVGSPKLVARAGVVTGEVAVTLGATGQGMVAGDAVNTAARVQAAAEPGAVLVDSPTRRLAAAAIGFDDAGEHTLKGKAGPERLWRATRVLAMVGGAARVDGLEAPLVGRDAELRTIKELFHAAADRKAPRMVVVSGAPGVGKSRLGWEFYKYVDGLVSTVWWHRGRCLSYGEGVAFWALAEAVRQRLGIAEEDVVDVAAEKLAAGLVGIVPEPAERTYVAVRLGRLLGVPAEGDTGDPLARDELFAGWRLFFERLAASAPVVLAIEDAQHADAGLLDFCDHLIDWARELPIFLLLLARPELEQRRRGYGIGRNRTVLTLDPLDAASMATLVDALVPGMPAAARQAITSHAQGVPLFAVETIRSLVDRDVVQPIDGVYRLVGDVGELAVPESLHGLLAARLDALPPPVRALVSDAAVLGTTFPVDALIAVSDQQAQAVRTGLAELVRREVLEVSADPLSPQRGAYRFAQNLLRQVAYETLSRRDRKLRHLAVAAHLRATFADDGEDVADVIARHYLDALSAVPDAADAAAIREEAATLSDRAAQRARRAGAPAAAAVSYSTAAELTEAAGSTDAGDLWERAADAAYLAADNDGSVRLAERAQQAHAAAGNARAAARAQALAGRALRRAGRHTAAREQLTAALEVLRVDPDRDTVDALDQLATVEIFDGRPEGDRLTAEALELGQAIGVDDALLAGLCGGRGLAHSHADRVTSASAYQRESARLAERSGDARAEGLALLNLSDILAAQDPPAAADAARRSIELLRRVGDRQGLSVAVTNLAEVLLTTGEWDEAAELLETALGPDGLDDEDYISGTLGMLAALRGDLRTAGSIVAGLPLFHASEAAQEQAFLGLLEALVAEASGRPAEALAAARRALDQNRVLGSRAHSTRWGWPLAARAAHALGDRSAAGELVAELDRHPVGHVAPVLRAERDLVAARLAAAGEPESAGALFERAVSALRRIPAPYGLAHALLDQAEFLAGAAQPAAAADAVREATAIAERLGAAPVLRRAGPVQSLLAGKASPAAAGQPGG